MFHFMLGFWVAGRGAVMRGKKVEVVRKMPYCGPQLATTLLKKPKGGDQINSSGQQHHVAQEIADANSLK